MTFSQGNLPAIIWNNGPEFTFVKRKLETTDEALIQKLKGYGYKELEPETDPRITPSGNIIEACNLFGARDEQDLCD